MTHHCVRLRLSHQDFIFFSLFVWLVLVSVWGFWFSFKFYFILRGGEKGKRAEVKGQGDDGIRTRDVKSTKNQLKFFFKKVTLPQNVGHLKSQFILSIH